MEQNVSMKINELPSPTWNWLKVNETPIKWSNKIEPCEIAAEGDAVSTETEQLSTLKPVPEEKQMQSLQQKILQNIRFLQIMLDRIKP